MHEGSLHNFMGVIKGLRISWGQACAGLCVIGTRQGGSAHVFWFLVKIVGIKQLLVRRQKVFIPKLMLSILGLLISVKLLFILSVHRTYNYNNKVLIH